MLKNESSLESLLKLFKVFPSMLADMATEIEAASLMTHQAGEDKNQGKMLHKLVLWQNYLLLRYVSKLPIMRLSKSMVVTVLSKIFL